MTGRAVLLAVGAFIVLTGAAHAQGHAAPAIPAPRADGLDGGAALRPLRTGTEPVVRRTAPVTRIEVNKPMEAPAWALAERHLMAMNGEGAQAFVDRFVDERGWLKGPAHWGIADGPDDAVEPIGNWPLAHMVGGPDLLIEQWRRLYEGHLHQFSQARVPEVEMARDGIYQREFSPSFDWEHIGEGIAGYLFYGLSRPDDPLYRVRMERFAGFYDGSDPAALNYDREHKIIRSLWNGSKGPTMRLPTMDEWDGPGVTGQNPLRRTRFASVTSIIGDQTMSRRLRQAGIVPRTAGKRKSPERGSLGHRCLMAGSRPHSRRSETPAMFPKVDGQLLWTRPHRRSVAVQNAARL